MQVMTYETTSHHCLRRAHELWNLENASAFTDVCGKLVIDFWEVEYRAAGMR